MHIVSHKSIEAQTLQNFGSRSAEEEREGSDFLKL